MTHFKEHCSGCMEALLKAKSGILLPGCMVTLTATGEHDGWCVYANLAWYVAEADLWISDSRLGQYAITIVSCFQHARALEALVRRLQTPVQPPDEPEQITAFPSLVVHRLFPRSWCCGVHCSELVAGDGGHRLALAGKYASIIWTALAEQSRLRNAPCFTVTSDKGVLTTRLVYTACDSHVAHLHAMGSALEKMVPAVTLQWA